MKVEKWIHINYEENDKWLFPIFNAIRKSLKMSDNDKFDNSFTELSYHISTRLEMLPIIYKRLNEGYSLIIEICKEQVNIEHISSKTKNGYVLEIGEELTHKMLIDIDSFLFEMNSCVELIIKLIEKIYSVLRINVENINEELMKMLLEKGQDKKWFKLLDSGRNFFTHDGTPFFAIDYTNSLKGYYDILIMKENLKVFDDVKKFYRLSDFNIIADGFYHSKNILAQHIILLCQNVN